MNKLNRQKLPPASAHKTVSRTPVQQTRAKPVAPPAYRPQPIPKVLQRKLRWHSRPLPQLSKRPRRGKRPPPRPSTDRSPRRDSCSRNTLPERINPRPPDRRGPPKRITRPAPAGMLPNCRHARTRTP